jgi:Bacterial Ig-like domain
LGATVGSVSADQVQGSNPYSWSFTTHEAPPSGQGVIIPIGWQFTSAVNASSMSMTVTKSSDGSSVSGTASYDSTNFLVSFVPTSPLTAGTKYLATLSGAKTTGGATIPTAMWTITPGVQKSTGWLGGVGAPLQGA